MKENSKHDKSFNYPGQMFNIYVLFLFILEYGPMGQLHSQPNLP